MVLPEHIINEESEDEYPEDSSFGSDDDDDDESDDENCEKAQIPKGSLQGAVCYKLFDFLLIYLSYVFYRYGRFR